MFYEFKYMIHIEQMKTRKITNISKEHFYLYDLFNSNRY